MLGKTYAYSVLFSCPKRHHLYLFYIINAVQTYCCSQVPGYAIYLGMGLYSSQDFASIPVPFSWLAIQKAWIIV
jgi:hypothetical protein